MRTHRSITRVTPGSRTRTAGTVVFFLAALTPLALPDTRRAQLVFEGERLAATARAGAGRVTTQDMTGFGGGWSGGGQLLWAGGSPGAALELAISVTQPAEYAIDMDFTRAPDYARVSVDIDGASGAAFDGYGSSVLPPSTLHAGSYFLAAGSHALRVRIDGKHPQSTGYLVGLDRIELSPVASEANPTRRAGEPPVPLRQLPVMTTARADAPVRIAQVIPPGARRAPGDTSAATGSCATSCLGDVSTVYRKDDDGQCRTWFRFPCSPFACEKGSGICRQACASTNDCAEGSQCNTNTGLCVVMPYACTDALTVRAANGQTESCVPYKCRAGTCRETCETSNDCSAGHACNACARCVKK